MTLDSIFSHFAESFGDPERTQSYTEPALSRSILVHEWPRFGDHIRTYSTDGYSVIEVPGCAKGKRFEFLITARELSFDSAARILLSVCRTPIQECLPPTSGETIALEHTIPGSSGMQRILLADVPDREQLGTLTVDGLNIEILLVVPIFESEFGFFRSRGEREFWNAFRRESLDLTDLRRPCLNAAHEFFVLKPAGGNQ